MKRKSLAMLFVTMLILSTVLLLVPPVAAAVSGCTVDPNSGTVYTPVTVTGQIDPPVAGHTIRIYWQPTPSPGVVPVDTIPDPVLTEADGTWEALINVPPTPAGDYYVVAMEVESGDYCSDTFKVKPAVQLECDCGCPCVCVEPCDDVLATGTGFAGGPGKWVHWDVGFESGSVELDAVGGWFDEFHVDASPGVYVFTAVDDDSNEAEPVELWVGPVLILAHDHGQPCDYIEVEGCLPGVVIGTSVEIYFVLPPEVQCVEGECCLPETVDVVVGDIVVSGRCGYFEGMIHVPELPTMGIHPYKVIATDEFEEVEAESWFWVHPCITIDGDVVDDAVEVQVGDYVTIKGHGFAQVANVTVWMSGLLPEDVPLEVICDLCDLVDIVSAWDHTNTWHILTVGLFLPVAKAPTDCLGYFEATFEVPECWGGYHLIVGTCEQQICHPAKIANIAHDWWDICYDCLVGPYLCMGCCAKVVNKPILRVLPKIWTDPACGVSGQTITLYGTGFSAFEFYVKYTDINFNQCPDLIECCKGEILTYLRLSGFVLDFGPNKRWIDGPYFPHMGDMLPCELWHKLHMGHYILNGQYDEAWGRASETDWNSYSPLMLNPRGTLVGDGMSFDIDLDLDFFKGLIPDCPWVLNLTFAWDYRQVGCPFLTVPWLQPQDVTLTAYRFDYIEIDFQAQWPAQDVVDLSLEFFTYDYAEAATADFTIECLKVDAGEFPECPECPEVDLSGIEDRLAALEGDLDALTELLNAIDAKITGLEDDEGKIIAKIDTAVGTIQEDLSALDGKIVKLDGDVATIGTAIGDIDVAIDDLDEYLTVTVDLATRIATIESDLGTIEGKLVSMEGKMATIETDVGTITSKADLIVNHTGSMPVTIALSLIAAIAAIAAAVLILRKVYIA